MNLGWIKAALINFLIAAVIGMVLRLAFIVELSWLNYRNWLHAHSHVAMLGWIYLALYAFLVPGFLGAEKAGRPVYRRLFWLTQISVLGMLVSFPIQGYGPFSIAFSTIHTVLSYAFAYLFLKDLRLSRDTGLISAKFAGLAVLFMLLSTLGLWAIGPLMALGGKGSAWYHLSLQWFLHFQFFGWFTFAIAALAFRWMEEKRLQLKKSLANLFFWLLTASSVLTVAFTAYWLFAESYLLLLNGVGVLLQLVALWILFRMLRPSRRKLRGFLSYWPGRLAVFAGAVWGVKVCMQTLTLVPAVTAISFTIRNFSIGFFHLFLLGVVSTFLVGLILRQFKAFRTGRAVHLGSGLFLTGVVLSEVLLFLQGFMLWGGQGFLAGYYEGLFIVSLLMPLGIALIGGSVLKRSCSR